MRWIVTILVFYLTALSSLTCSDGRSLFYKSLIQAEVVQSSDHPTDNEDTCSPFCYCNCCSVSISSFDFKSFEIKPPKTNFISKKIRPSDYSLVSNFYGNIWQPPKLSV